jgi:hypothetical protein
VPVPVTVVPGAGAADRPQETLYVKKLSRFKFFYIIFLELVSKKLKPIAC